MKYKVGDRVNTCFGVGTVVFVKETGCPYLIKHNHWGGGHNGNIGLGGVDKLKLRGNHCFWMHESDLTKVANHKVIITTDGINVTARLKEDGIEIKKAIAKCNPQDTFDFEVGAKLAFERLFEKEEKPKLYNAKVVCVEECPGASTKGKIYEIKDGKIKFDGWEGCEVVHNDLADLNKRCVSKFIEVVE